MAKLGQLNISRFKSGVSVDLPPTSPDHVQPSFGAVRLKPPDVEVLDDDYHDVEVFHDDDANDDKDKEKSSANCS